MSGTTSRAGTLQYEVCDDHEAPRSLGSVPRGIRASSTPESLLGHCLLPARSTHRHKTVHEGYLFAHLPLSSEIRHRVWPDPKQTGEGEGRRERWREEESCCCWRGFARLAGHDVVSSLYLVDRIRYSTCSYLSFLLIPADLLVPVDDAQRLHPAFGSRD